MGDPVVEDEPKLARSWLGRLGRSRQSRARGGACLSHTRRRIVRSGGRRKKKENPSGLKISNGFQMRL